MYGQFVKEEHLIFSEEIIRFLLNDYGIEEYPEEDEACPVFTTDMGEAVVTISNIFQKEYRKTFNLLRESLKNCERFEEYCMVILVEQNHRYFYNFLRRVSLIFELAMYCFQYKYSSEEGYFSVAYRCIIDYSDWEYFEDVGGWEGLQHTASFLANIGRPLKLIMKDAFLQDQNIQTFSDVVGTLHEDYLYTANIEMLDSKEMRFLEDLKKLSRANSGYSTRKGRSSSSHRKHSSGKKSALKTEEEILKKYFKCCLNSRKKRRNVSDTPATSSVETAVKSLPIIETPNEPQKRGRGILKERFGGVQENTYLIAGSSRQYNYGSSNSWIPLQQTVTYDLPETDQGFEDPCLNNEPELPEVVSEVQNTDGGHCIPKKQDSACSEIEIVDSPRVPQDPASHTITEYMGEASYSGTELKPVFVELSEYSKVTTEIEYSGADGGGKKVKHNFIVPEKYFFMNERGRWDECKYLYCAKVDPPSKKRKMDKPLKEILDANIDGKNYRQMSSGDVYVSSPDPSSREEETLVVFIDSSSDEEDVGDEETDRMVCLFKKCDLDLENEEGETYNLRPRKIQRKDTFGNKLAGRGAEQKEAKFSAGPSALRSRLIRAANRAAYVKYLMRLYKKHLPQTLDDCLNSYQPGCFQNESNMDTVANLPSSGNERESSRPICGAKRKTVFVLTAGLLAKRNLDLLENKETEVILGESESSLEFEDFNPQPLRLSDSDLNSYIKCGEYTEIYPGVFTIGEFSEDTANMFLFAPRKPDSSLDDHHLEILRVTRAYKEAARNCPGFTNVTLDFLACIEGVILRLLKENEKNK